MTIQTIINEEKNHNLKNRYCEKCKIEISYRDLPNVFKISIGISIEDTFFPYTKAIFYHKECL